MGASKSDISRRHSEWVRVGVVACAKFSPGGEISTGDVGMYPRGKKKPTEGQSNAIGRGTDKARKPADKVMMLPDMIIARVPQINDTETF